MSSNPAKAVRKPSGVRERAVVCLETARAEAIRAVLLAQGRSYAATYAHVTRELKRLPRLSAEAQIRAARQPRRPQVDHGE